MHSDSSKPGVNKNEHQHLYKSVKMYVKIDGQNWHDTRFKCCFHGQMSRAVGLVDVAYTRRRNTDSAVLAN